MKKNFLFKGVSVLGAMLLLANVVLPGLAYAADVPADWTMYAIHANPVSKDGTNTCTAMIGGGNQCQENGGDGTYTTDDGIYTIESSDGGKTLTYSNITLKEPGDAIAGQAWTEGRMSGHIYLGVRFIIPSTVNEGAYIKKGEKNFYQSGVDHVDRRGQSLTSTEVKDLVSSGTFTKEWAYSVSSNGTSEEEFKVIADLSNITIKDEQNHVLLEVKNGKITKLDGEDAVKITFDGANEQVIASGTNAQKPADPTKDCNSFDGWYNGDEKFDFTTPITGNLALTSKWTYTCSRSSGGGGGSSRTTTTSKDDTKATTGDNKTVDTAKVDEQKADETKANEENKAEEKATMTDAQAVAKFGQEQIDAYKWALENGITTMKTVEEARLDQPLTRAELAKMMVVYVAKVLGKQPVVTGSATYDDVDNSLGDLAGYIQLAYQYQIMGINADGTPIDFFNPNGLVTRGEYATVFSRVLFGALFNKEGEDFYTNHLKALEAAGILSNTEPTIQEMRGWVMLMMYRSSKNTDKIAEVISTLGASEQEAADAQAKAEEEKVVEAPVEATTGDVAEAPEAEATTGDVAEAPEAEATTGDVVEAPAEASTGDTVSD